MAAAKAADAPAVVLEEGADPETGRDRNSSVPRPFDVDAPVEAVAVVEARIVAVERELAAYEAAGKKARATACRDELKRLAKELSGLTKAETTDDDGPGETT